MKPEELYSIDLLILSDIIQCYIKAENEAFDQKMQMLAWQTSLLMNSTGNYKRSIKPQDLYTPMEQVESEENEKSKEALQQELLEAFAGSNIVVS